MTGGVFDYRKAFDLIDHALLARKLLALDMPAGVSFWIIDFLTLGLGQIGIVVITLKFASITERCLTQYPWNLVEVYSSLVVHAKRTFIASL